MTSGYGYRQSPTSGASTYHKGVDLAGNVGDTVSSYKSGTVIQAGWDNNGGGNYVKVDHGNGMVTTYMHLSKISVKSGDKVSAGSKLGEVGSTGISTGPHLDFRICINGSYVDPMNYLK